MYTHVLMRDEGRKKEASKQGQTNNKAKQHSTPKAVTFPKKNELPWVGLEPTTLTYMYMLMRDAEGRKEEASKQGHACTVYMYCIIRYASFCF